MNEAPRKPAEVESLDELGDATVVVAAPVVDDATVVVAAPVVDDATVVVAAPVVDDATVVVAAPVAIADIHGQFMPPPSGARLSLHPARATQPENFLAVDAALEFERALGAPPAAYAIGFAERKGLPSAARLKRKFGIIAWVGVVVIPLLSGFGLWWVFSQLFRV